MPLYMPNDDETELRAFMAAGLHLYPCNANGVPTSRTWRAQASSRPEALSMFMRQPTCAGFIGRLGQGLCVVTVRGLRAEGLAAVEARLGALPETVTARLPAQMTALWLRATPGLPSARISDSVTVRSGVEGCALPPSITRGMQRWAWNRQTPSTTAISRLPEQWEAEVRRIVEGELAEAA